MPRWRSRPRPESCLTPYPGTGHSLTLVESLTIGQLAQLAGAHDSAVGVVAAARAKLRALDERQKELDAIARGSVFAPWNEG